MQSMTGYGKAEFMDEFTSLVIEIKTINNRFLDINLKSPKALSPFEDMIRKSISKKLTRGRVDVFISYTDKRELSYEIQADTSLATSYYETAMLLKEKFPMIENDLTITSLMRVPDLVKVELKTKEDENLGKILEDTLNNCLDALNKMREKEAEKLVTDMLLRLNTITESLDGIQKLSTSIIESYREKLKKRMEEYLVDVKYDEARLLNEVAFFTDKCNIDEEITRLNSHVKQFRKIVENNEGGKKLDFLLQEFNREANTICSKANNIDVTNLGLTIKCEIEKIREQVQNIE